MLAASGNHVECIELLIDAGASPLAADEHGLTPLHYAAEGGHVDAIKVLLERGAPYDAADEGGKTAVDVARAWGFRGAALALEDAAPEIDAEIVIDDDSDAWPEGGTVEPRQMRMPENLQPEKMEL